MTGAASYELSTQLSMLEGNEVVTFNTRGALVEMLRLDVVEFKGYGSPTYFHFQPLKKTDSEVDRQKHGQRDGQIDGQEDR